MALGRRRPVVVAPFRSLVMGPKRNVALLAVAAVLAAAPAVAAPWVLDDGLDPFSDQRVVRAAARNDVGDAVSVTCDENLALVTVFAPAREIRAGTVTVKSATAP